MLQHDAIAVKEQRKRFKTYPAIPGAGKKQSTIQFLQFNILRSFPQSTSHHDSSLFFLNENNTLSLDGQDWGIFQLGQRHLEIKKKKSLLNEKQDKEICYQYFHLPLCCKFRAIQLELHGIKKKNKILILAYKIFYPENPRESPEN